jgi:GTP-binding protein EngB required for normal cell division
MKIEKFLIIFPIFHIFPELHHIAVEAMKTEEKNSSPKVRIAVLGNMNVGKSGE